MTKDRIHILMQKLFKGECSLEEKEELALWIDTFPDEEEWLRHLRRIWKDYEPDTKLDGDKAVSIWKEIVQEDTSQKSVPRLSARLGGGMMRWAVAAAAVIAALIILSIIFIVPKPEEQNDMATTEEPTQKKQIMPGGNKAILTLANGKQVVLDSVRNGKLSNPGNTNIIKLNSGLLSYNQTPNGQKLKANSQQPTKYNTITTPRGGQYEVILPDGSKVWLNAVSSIKFPTAFNGKKRNISIKGEVYAEIARDENRPFIVDILSSTGAHEGSIKVLGTSFNVNAYTENAGVTTTLLKGSIRVEKGRNKKTLEPGEQALMQENDLRVQKADYPGSVVAWKNGDFDFDGNDIDQVMQRIARWYDVEIKYEKKPTSHFMGVISRFADVSEVLDMLEMTGAVHFKIEGKTIVVSE